MMTRKEAQARIYSVTYSDLIPRNHFLRKLDELIDFNFIYEKTAPLYSKTGRPSIDPVVLMKMLLIGYLYGIDSERRLEDEINYNLAYKWFVGLDLDEKAPDHCIFSANRRRRFSSRIFEDILEEIVRRCIELKLVDGRLLLTDSTHIKANVNKENQEKIFVTETPSAYMQKLDKEALEQGLVDKIPEYISEIITDEAELSELKEADKIDEEINKKIKKKRKKNSKTVVRNGKKIRVKKVAKNISDPDSGLLFRDKKPRIFGYLSHNTVDSKNGITLAVTVTPANVSDNVPHAEQILGILNKYKFDTYAIGADSGFDSSEIYFEMYKRGIKCFIIPQKRSGTDAARYENLKYNRNQDCYFCPAGKKIDFKSYSVGTGYKHYSIDKEECERCPRKSSCREFKSISLGMHERERREQQKLVGTDEWREALRLRQIWCEGNFARQKESHNLNRTRKRGIEKIKEQCLLSACALNLKRMVKCRV